MANDIGSVKGINGTSNSLNGQAGQGAVKPVVGSKTTDAPPKPAEAGVPMPK